MKSRTSSAVSATLFAACSIALAAESKRDAEHVKKDIAAHRILAEAHSNAAKCLESGTPEKVCQEALARDCKSVGIGRYCGMKHRH
jgi:hypothetical protein